MNNELQYIQQKLQDVHADVKVMSTKLDNHLERLTRAETNIEHLRGHIKVSTTIFLSVISVLVLTYWDKLAAILFTLGGA